jgi:hypothetical protein
MATESEHGPLRADDLGSGYVVLELTAWGELLVTPSPVTLAEARALTSGEQRYVRRIRYVGMGRFIPGQSGRTTTDDPPGDVVTPGNDGA